MKGFAYRILLGLVLIGGAAGLNCVAADPEVSLSEEEFKKLDTFEGHALEKADAVFVQRDYRRAAAEYDAFLLQFAKSAATPYAVLRKARCLQLDNKRYEAIKGYNEVLDYFPNALRYAGAALYYLGECQFDNGDLPEALKAWAEMAQDQDYRKHSLAAGAINRLADNLVQQKKQPEAIPYYQQVAVDFRSRNPDAARYAMGRVIDYYVRSAPDAKKLREFYDQVQTFEHNPGKPDEGNYWSRVREQIRRLGNFPEDQKAQRDTYYRYWVSVMENQHTAWDDYQVDVAEFKRVYETDTKAWLAWVNQRFQQHEKPGDYGRVIKWLGVLRGLPEAVEQYYQKLDFGKMKNGEIQELVRVLYDRVNDPARAKHTFGKLKLDEMTDEQKYHFARYLWHRDEELVQRVYARYGDVEAGQMELLRYWHWRRNAEKGLPVAVAMTQVSRFSKEAYWLKAEMLEWQNKWAEAIAAYQAADNPPHSLYRIADCFKAAGKRDQALAQLREIENFFKDQAPEAAWRIAGLQRETGDKKLYVAALRGVMNKYPKSPQSSAAHQELQKMGIKTGGGEDAE